MADNCIPYIRRSSANPNEALIVFNYLRDEVYMLDPRAVMFWLITQQDQRDNGTWVDGLEDELDVEWQADGSVLVTVRDSLHNRPVSHQLPDLNGLIAAIARFLVAPLTEAAWPVC